MKKTRSFTIVEAGHLTGLEPSHIIEFIRHEWIYPADPGSTSLDEEDVARIQLIRELRRDFGVNEEAIPLILHLVDQLCSLREEVRRRARTP